MEFADFMPAYGPGAAEQAPKEVDPAVFLAKVKAMNARMGGKTKKSGNPS
jgi:hypothetical protein